MFVGVKQLLHHQVSTTSTVRYAAIAALLTVLAISMVHEMDPFGWQADLNAPIIVVVHQGDTLWTLARTYGRPSADPRRTISRIRETNNLVGSLIQPGEVLLVPQS
jgi:hypothetical protein